MFLKKDHISLITAELDNVNSIHNGYVGTSNFVAIGSTQNLLTVLFYPTKM